MENHPSNSDPRVNLDPAATRSLGPLSNDDYLRFAQKLTAELLMVTFEEVPLVPDNASRDQIAETINGGVNFRPATGPYALIGQRNQIPIGWATLRRDQGVIVQYFQANNHIGATARIGETLRLMAPIGNQRARAVLVVEQQGPVGVIFPLTLNAPPVRSFFYHWLLVLEMSMLQLVNQLHPMDSWKSLGAISADELADLEHQRMKRESLEPDALLWEFLFFRQALLVLNHTRSMQMRETKSSSIPAYPKELNGLRNTIMHPRRPLVVTDQSVWTLREQYEHLKRLVEKTKACSRQLASR